MLDLKDKHRKMLYVLNILARGLSSLGRASGPRSSPLKRGEQSLCGI